MDFLGSAQPCSLLIGFDLLSMVKVTDLAAEMDRGCAEVR